MEILNLNHIWIYDLLCLVHNNTYLFVIIDPETNNVTYNILYQDVPHQKRNAVPQSSLNGGRHWHNGMLSTFTGPTGKADGTGRELAIGSWNREVANSRWVLGTANLRWVPGRCSRWYRHSENGRTSTFILEFRAGDGWLWMA